MLKVKTSGNFFFSKIVCVILSGAIRHVNATHIEFVFRLFNYRHGQIDTASLYHLLLTCSFQLCIYSPNENQKAKTKIGKQTRRLNAEKNYVYESIRLCGGQTEASNGNSRAKY